MSDILTLISAELTTVSDTLEVNSSSNDTESLYWNMIWAYFEEGSSESCQLMGSLSIMIQFILFFVAISTLLIKRVCETPQRHWKVFYMDTSKQICSSGMLHLINLLVAKFIFGKQEKTCEWYFINFSVDIFGIPIFVYLLVRIGRILISPRFADLLEMGNYNAKYEQVEKDNPKKKLIINEHSKAVYIKQLIMWMLIVFFAKACVLGFMVVLADQVMYCAVFLLFPVNAYPHMLLILVILMFPLGFNVIQFWVIDEYLRDTKDHSYEDYLKEKSNNKQRQDIEKHIAAIPEDDEVRNLLSFEDDEEDILNSPKDESGTKDENSYSEQSK